MRERARRRTVPLVGLMARGEVAPTARTDKRESTPPCAGKRFLRGLHGCFSRFSTKEAPGDSLPLR